MPAIIRADYKALRALHDQFADQRDRSRQVHDQIEAQLTALKRGRWQTEAAADFYRSMDSEVMEAVKRLIHALDHASDLMLAIIQVMQRAEQDAAAGLPTGLDGAPSLMESAVGYLGAQFDQASGWLAQTYSNAANWTSQQVQNLQTWILNNNETFKTIDNVMGLIPAEGLLLLGPKGAIAYGVFLGVQTGVKYLANFDQNPGLVRGLGVAAIDTGIGAGINAFGGRYAKAAGFIGRLGRGAELYDIVGKVNNGLQIGGRYLPGMAGGLLDSTNLSQPVMDALNDAAQRLSSGIAALDIGKVTYGASELIFDAVTVRGFSNIDSAAVFAEQNGFPQFRQINQALGITPQQNDFGRDLGDLGGTVVNMGSGMVNIVEGSVDTLLVGSAANMAQQVSESVWLSDGAKAAFQERVDAFSTYILENNLLLQPHNPMLRMTTGGLNP
jgi:WXG100 family type VII secretion target